MGVRSRTNRNRGIIPRLTTTIHPSEAPMRRAIQSMLFIAVVSASIRADDPPAKVDFQPFVAAQKVPPDVAPMPRDSGVQCCDGGAFVNAVIQEKQPVAAKDAKTGLYPRGYKPAPPEVSKARHAAAAIRHDGRVSRLPEVVAPAFDAREMGWCHPIKDQGPCGSCYQFSGAGPCTDAFIKAGQKSIFGTGNGFAEQYGMDCHRNWGGCNGGDELDIISWAKTNGLPTEADYGKYRGGSTGTCKTGVAYHKIADWGYCTPGQQNGVASTADMQKCIAAYGPISVAFDAGGCDSYQGGIMRGRGSNVDHAVMCIGWKTQANGKVAFLGQNQWGTSWGESGYFWIEEGSYSWGTEAIWVVATPLPPPPPPPSPFTVTLTSSVATGQSPLPVTFSYTSAGGTATSAAIDFGDNTSSTTLPATHNYASSGTYVATLAAVSGDSRATSKVTITVTGIVPPPPPPPGPAVVGDITIQTDTGPLVVSSSGKTVTLPAGWKSKGEVLPSLAADLAAAGVPQALIDFILKGIRDASGPEAKPAPAPEPKSPGGWLTPRRRYDREPVMGA